jgi:hypothetical protein
MQFDSYRWQDHAQNHYRRGVDLALTLVFLVILGAGAVLQSHDNFWPAFANDRIAFQTASAEAPENCDA